MKNKLSTEYDCDVKDPHTVGMKGREKGWGKAIQVRREDYKDRKTGKRAALIYWDKEDGELIINSFIDEGVKYKWNYVPATKKWSEYDYESGL